MSVSYISKHHGKKYLEISIFKAKLIFFRNSHDFINVSKGLLLRFYHLLNKLLCYNQVLLGTLFSVLFCFVFPLLTLQDLLYRNPGTNAFYH